MAGEPDDNEFDALLSAALGLTSGGEGGGGGGEQQQRPPPPPPLASSAEPSPMPSPVHVPPGSPALSSDSVQLHASPPCASPASYSPVRAPASPPPGQLSPVRLGEPAAAAAQQPAPLALDAQPPPPQRAQPQLLRRVRARLQQQLLPAPAAARPQPAQLQPPQPPSTHSFTNLPREVQMRVLFCLSADALTTLSCTCSTLAALCSEPVLWRRLCCARWGKQNLHGQGAASRLSWKARYMERDLAELRAAGGAGGGGDAMQAMFAQAQLAKRHQALGVGAVDDLMLVEDDEVAARVMAWRKARGFDAQGAGPGVQPPRPPDLGSPPGPRAAAACAGGGAGSGGGGGAAQALVRRPCPGPAGGDAGPASAAPAAGAAAGSSSSAARPAQPGSGGVPCDARPPRPAAPQSAGGASAGGPSSAAAAAATAAACSSSAAASARQRPARRRWTQIGNVFCCEQTGWVHVCDETCSERIVERSSGLLVCPVSGLVSARMLTCAEEAEEEGERDAEGDAECGGERGRLARAYAAGYSCDTEEELRIVCGVRMPH